MKKLLVILLLLFPVHGAWAEKITLQCTHDVGSTKITKSWNIDTKKEQVFWDGGQGQELRVTDDDFLFFSNSFKDNKNAFMHYYLINRNTGDYTVYRSKYFSLHDVIDRVYDLHNMPEFISVYNGECKKSKKKKF